MYNHNKAQQSKNRVHISWDILYIVQWHPIVASTHHHPMQVRYISHDNMDNTKLTLILIRTGQNQTDAAGLFYSHVHLFSEMAYISNIKLVSQNIFLHWGAPRKIITWHGILVKYPEYGETDIVSQLSNYDKYEILTLSAKCSAHHMNDAT